MKLRSQIAWNIRLLTMEDPMELSNAVLQLRLPGQDRQGLVAFMRTRSSRVRTRQSCVVYRTEKQNGGS